MSNFWEFITKMPCFIRKKEFRNICSFSVPTSYLIIIQVKKPLYKFLLMRKQKPLKIRTVADSKVALLLFTRIIAWKTKMTLLEK